MRLGDGQKEQIAWTRWERVVSVLYWVFTICGIIGISVVLLSDTFIAAGDASTALGRGMFAALCIVGLLCMAALVSLMLFIFTIVLIYKLSTRNYRRLLPLVLGTIFIELLWFFLLVIIVINSNIKFLYILIPSAAVLVSLVANIYYRGIYHKDIAGQNIIDSISEVYRKTIQEISLAFLIVVFVLVVMVFPINALLH